MPNCSQRCIEEEAKQFYINKMDDYYKNCHDTMIFDGKFTSSVELLVALPRSGRPVVW